MKRLLTLFFLLAHLFTAAQCPDCAPDLSCVSDDNFPAICPLVLPDATAAVYYETVLTFYLPSAVVDPDTGIEADLLEVEINNVTGLPFGMAYVTNSETNTYFPSQGENHGCATLCGTPLISGDYEITIAVTVLVSALGFEQAIQESFSLPLTVLPGEGGNTSFTYNDLFGCGELEVAFEALIDGSPGVTSYAWDFGNGNIGNVANPPAQSYDEAGEYEVSLETTIEDYTLNSVTLTQIASGWGGDVEELSEALFSPDPYFTITDGNGAVVYTSGSVTDVNSASWNGLSLILTNPPYTISIYDEDNGGLFGSADDFLGSTEFAMTEGSQGYTAGGNSGAIGISLQVTNTFVDTETVTVFPIPDAAFAYSEDPAMLSYDDPDLALFVWTLFGDTIQEGPVDSLLLTAPGVYTCHVTSVYGCSATSDEFTLCPTIVLSYDANAETLSVGGGFESYTWFFNGLEVSGESGNVIDASTPGNYAVTITTNYGCEVTSEVYTVATSVEESSIALSVWPNPTSGILYTDLTVGDWALTIYASDGRLVHQEQVIGGAVHTINLNDLSEGSYFVEAVQGATRLRSRVLLTR